VQVRCLLEGVPVEDILADWHGLLQEYMQRWQLDRSKVRQRSYGQCPYAMMAGLDLHEPAAA
jgi:hypothetical protein